MFKFKVNGKTYDFTYDNLVFNISSQEFDADDVKVICDGKEKDKFGVSFRGHSYTVDDALCAAIVAYVNNDTSYDFILVPTEIKKIRSGFFKKQLTTNGRDIPKQILTPDLEVGNVKMITKAGQAAYLDDYGDVSVLTYADGSVATDMENFFMEGVTDLYQEEKIVFIDPEFEGFLKEYLTESAGIKNIVNKILEGVSIREALAADDIGEDFIKNANKFKNYLLHTYSFVSKVIPDIRQETKYIANFCITVDTDIDYYADPADSISKYNLENVVQGDKVYYGTGIDPEVEYDLSSISKGISDSMYKDSFKFDLVPCKETKTYALMKYSNTSYSYSYDRTPSNKLTVKLWFYTDRGIENKN